jgi:hypothetical protein
LQHNQALKLTVGSWVQNSWLLVGLRFYYSVFSTYNYDTYQFGFQHELVARSAMAQKTPFRLVHFENLRCSKNNKSRYPSTSSGTSGIPACRRQARFDHNLIGKHQICRMGTYLSAIFLGGAPIR